MTDPSPDDRLPEGLIAYRRTPEFDQDSIPAGLRRTHRTRPGVWALIHVVEGRLLYRVLDPPSETLLAPGEPGVVRPGQPHQVEPVGPVRFHVAFHAAEAAPDSGDGPDDDLPHER